MRRRAERALAELGAAAPLGAVCLLLANDHHWKRLFHNALTGKLSDIAICFLLPLLVSAALGLVCDWPGRRRLAVGAVVASLVFTLLELSDTAGAVFVRATGALGLGGGALTRDPTDLLALACVPLAVVYGQRRLAVAERGPNLWRSATGALVMVTGSLALMATSMSGPCSQQAAPVMFQAEAGCGPGGLIVVRSSMDYPPIQISNAAALGLPSFTYSPSDTTWSDGHWTGDMCLPNRFDQGRWEVIVRGCVSVDGGASACGPGIDIVTLQTCEAVLVDGVGSFTCKPGDGGAPCVSHLTVVRDGGTDGALGGVDGSSNPAADGPSDVSPGGS